MNSPSDLLAEAGLEVKEQGISEELARDFSLECAELLVSESIPPIETGVSSIDDEVSTIRYRIYPARLFANTGFTAIQKVLKLNPYKDDPKATIAINHQAPHSVQKFHSDFSPDKQVVVHGNDRGLFDFSIDHDPDHYYTIEVNAGSVVTQNNPVVLHRGRNPSDLDRYNAVLGLEYPFDLYA